MPDLRLGVIGVGQRATLAATAHRPGRGCRVTALCDTDPAALTRFDVEHTFTDYRDLLEHDVDAVLVATPDDTHAEIAIAALTAGKAVYLEKPLAITIDDCDEVLRTAARTGTRLYLEPQHAAHGRRPADARHHPAGRDRRAEDHLGAAFRRTRRRVLLQDWHADRSRTTGLLLQKAAHDTRRDPLAQPAATPNGSAPSAISSCTGTSTAARPAHHRPKAGSASGPGRRRRPPGCTT